MAIAVFAFLNIVQFLSEVILSRASWALHRRFAVRSSVREIHLELSLGIARSLMGVPIVIAEITDCEEHDSAKWIEILLSGTRQEGTLNAPPLTRNG